MKEEPAPGVRAIRICANRPGIFLTQLRAMYRASAYGGAAAISPLIASLREVKKCKRACRKLMAELGREGIPCRQDTGSGIMIEPPHLS